MPLDIGEIEPQLTSATDLIDAKITEYRARFISSSAAEAADALKAEPSGNVLVQKAQLRIVLEKQVDERAAKAAAIVASLKKNYPKVEVDIDKTTGQATVYAEGKPADIGMIP